MLVVRWSADWRTATPWSLGGRVMPYVGVRRSTTNRGRTIRFLAIGPLGLAIIAVRKDPAHG